MTDYSGLVERLKGDGNDECDHDGCLHCMREAADAIEALMAEVDGENRFSVWANNPRTVALMARDKAQRERIERLEGALRMSVPDWRDENIKFSNGRIDVDASSANREHNEQVRAAYAAAENTNSGDAANTSSARAALEAKL